MQALLGTSVLSGLLEEYMTEHMYTQGAGGVWHIMRPRAHPNEQCSHMGYRRLCFEYLNLSRVWSRNMQWHLTEIVPEAGQVCRVCLEHL